MRDDLRERREETWDMLVVKGLNYGTVVGRLSEKYDVAEGTIKYDIHVMDDWLPELDEISTKSGVSRLRELRQNRQRLQQMAVEARREGDRREELAIRRQLDKALQTDIELSQTLGETEREPDRVEVDGVEGALFANLKNAYAEDDADGDGDVDAEEPGGGPGP